MKKPDKASLREAAALQLRGMRDLHRLCPGMFVGMALCMAVQAITPYVTVYLSAQLINELAGLRRAEVLVKWALLILLAQTLLGLLGAALERKKEAGLWILAMRRRQMTTKKLLTMDFADADNQRTHDLRAQILQNESWSGWGIMKAYYVAEEFCKAGAGVLGAIALTVSLFALPVPQTGGRLTLLNHPLFLLALLVLLGAVTATVSFCSNRATQAWAQAAASARLGNRVFSAFTGFACEADTAADIRMYQQRDIAEHYMERCNVFGKGGVFDQLARGIGGAMMTMAGSVSAVLTGVVYAFVCLKAWAGAFGVGSVTQYVGAVTALSKNISMLVETAGTMRSNAPFLRTFYEFMDIPNAMYQGSLTTEKRADRQYDVEFRDVSFKYPGSDVWALRHVSLRFQVGKRLAVVGENGSGKSTFIKLLCRLYDPQEGKILLNGIDIRKYSYRDYMNVFSVVFQDFRLLSQPLGANVAGSAQYDAKRVTRALCDAGFGERLKTLPNGLDTQLYREFTDEGVEVSGGEAQKIAIARALHKDAPFIILDEPTAALDPIAEAEIYSQFSKISGDRTAIYISHRLSSCKFCDEILVFDRGQVVQQGTHDALLGEEGGRYHALWHAQAQYYVKQDA